MKTLAICLLTAIAHAQSINLPSADPRHSFLRVDQTAPGKDVTVLSYKGNKVAHTSCSTKYLQVYAPGTNPAFYFDSVDKCKEALAAIGNAVSSGIPIKITLLMDQTPDDWNSDGRVVSIDVLKE